MILTEQCDKFAKCSINLCCAVYSFQCILYIKCTCSDSGAFAGAGAVRNVHCAVCRVQCADELAVQTGRVKLKFHPKE